MYEMGGTAQNPSAWSQGLELAPSTLSPPGCVLLVSEQSKKKTGRDVGHSYWRVPMYDQNTRKSLSQRTHDIESQGNQSLRGVNLHQS